MSSSYGEVIFIWDDPWVNNLQGFRVEDRRADVNNIWCVCVCDLINSNSMCWNSVLIRRYFSVEEANAILSIPLSVGRYRDGWLWAFSNGGRYSIK